MSFISCLLILWSDLSDQNVNQNVANFRLVYSGRVFVLMFVVVPKLLPLVQVHYFHIIPIPKTWF